MALWRSTDTSSEDVVRAINQERSDWLENVAQMEETNTYHTVVGTSDKKRSLGRPRRRCKDNINMGWTKVVKNRVE
jgi:hypothetical protein